MSAANTAKFVFHFYILLGNDSVSAHMDSFSDFRGVSGLFRHPTQDHVPPKSPFVAEPEARNLPQPHRLIYRGRLTRSILQNSLSCQDLIVAIPPS